MKNSHDSRPVSYPEIDIILYIKQYILSHFSHGYGSVDTTIVRTQNMLICHSLRCKEIDMSMADK